MSNLFLNNNSFTGAVSKYFELSKDVFINGVRYDKYTKNVINPIQIADLRAINNEMIVKKMAYPLKEGYLNKTESNCTWVKDINNENIYYVFSHNGKNSTYFNHFNVVKFNENINSVCVDILNIGTGIHTGSSLQYTYDIIHQDNNYVYTIAYYLNGLGKSEGYFYLQKFNKKTLVFETITHANSTNPNVIKIFPNLDVLIGTIYRNYIYVYNYNLLTNRNNNSKHIVMNNTASGKSIVFSDLDKKNNFYFLNPSEYVNGYSNLEVYKYNINLLTISKMNVINGNISEIKNIDDYNLRCYTFEKDNREYLIAGVTLAVSKRTTATAEELSYIKFSLFEMQDDNLVLLDEFNDGNLYTNVLFNEEKGLLLLGSYKTFSIIKITDDLLLENTYTNNKLCLTYGIDEDNKIYFQNLDTSIEEISVGSGVSILSEFEKDIYQYQGIDIYSNLKVAVKDILGDYVDCKVQIMLSGDITFNDNQKTKEIILSKVGFTNIPIVIKGESKIKANIKIL